MSDEAKRSELDKYPLPAGVTFRYDPAAGCGVFTVEGDEETARAYVGLSLGATQMLTKVGEAAQRTVDLAASVQKLVDTLQQSAATRANSSWQKKQWLGFEGGP